MIAQIWHGTVPSATATDFRDFVTGHVIPGFQSVPGNLSLHLLERKEGGVTHVVALTPWESLDAVRGRAGRDGEAARYCLQDKHFLSNSSLA